jgi:hypothetical protein
LIDRQTLDHGKPSLWEAIPRSVQREVLQALIVMLSSSLLWPNKEESND